MWIHLNQNISLELQFVKNWIRYVPPIIINGSCRAVLILWNFCNDINQFVIVTLEYCLQTVQTLNLENLTQTRGGTVAPEKQLQFLNNVHYQNYESTPSGIGNHSPFWLSGLDPNYESSPSDIGNRSPFWLTCVDPLL